MMEKIKLAYRIGYRCGKLRLPRDGSAHKVTQPSGRNFFVESGNPILALFWEIGRKIAIGRNGDV